MPAKLHLEDSFKSSNKEALQDDIPKLIDLNQTGFIKGRSISDTFVYALELVQVCHKRKRPALVLKLDFAKAFDTELGGSVQSAACERLQ